MFKLVILFSIYRHFSFLDNKSISSSISFRLTMSVEYQRKRIRLKKQWAYIDAALRIVQLTQQSANQKYLLEAMMKSDSSTFDRLLNDDPTLVQCPIPVGYNHFNIYQIIVERATDTFIEHVFTKYLLLIEQSTDGGKLLIPVACERGE